MKRLGINLGRASASPARTKDSASIAEDPLWDGRSEDWKFSRSLLRRLGPSGIPR
jgi:hypothetical protein